MILLECGQGTREEVIKLLGKYIIILVVKTVGLHFMSISTADFFSHRQLWDMDSVFIHKNEHLEI